MQFDSLPFLFFLPAVVLLFYILPHAFRWVFLLAASYFFYGSWKVEFLTLIIFSTLTIYFAALAVNNAKTKLMKLTFLFGGAGVILFLLFVFKYFNFFLGRNIFFSNEEVALLKENYVLNFLKFGVPVGISFFTFQAVGYLVDVYRKEITPEKNPFKFALFISYFPQLVAGPIERFKNLHSQLFQKVKLEYANLSNGFRLVLYGLFIKMVIADNLAPLIDPVFQNPLVYSQIDNLIALVLFGIQIYADFHGYSTIAIGVALMMGVHLMDNFRTPYFATSIKEFWTRWHISLSTWFRDYLYLPLGGNRVSYFRWMMNISIVFIVSGIWHGANSTFLIWGLIHGCIYLTEIISAKFISKKINRNLAVVFGFIKTFIIVQLAWLFFRSDTLAKAYLSLSKMLGTEISADRYYSIQAYDKSTSDFNIDQIIRQTDFQQSEWNIPTVVYFLLVIFLMMEIWINKERFDKKVASFSFVFRWAIYAILIYAVMVFSGPQFFQFIYFQF